MEQRRRLVGGLQLCLEFLPASVERLHFGFPFVHGDLVVEHQVQQLLDPRADPLDLAFCRRQAGASLHPQTVHLASEFLAELCEQLLVQELLLQRLQHARFDLVAADGEVVVAASLITSAEAAETMLAGHDESGAADAALRQSREQVLRAPRADGIAGGSDRVSTESLALLGVCPQFVGHDAQLRDFLPHPLAFRVEARHALTGVGILHVPKAIPHEPTDVEVVVQDSCPALGVSVDRARAPVAAERTNDAFPIQVLGDLLGRDASDEVAEDLLDDRRLAPFDLARTGRDVSASQRLDDSIPVAQAAGGLAVLDSAAQSTVRLLGEILQEQGVHRSLESYVQVRDVALGDGDDVHAGKRQSLEQAGGVFLVTAESIE